MTYVHLAVVRRTMFEVRLLRKFRIPSGRAVLFSPLPVASVLTLFFI
jgi:hypothetical protein